MSQSMWKCYFPQFLECTVRILAELGTVLKINIKEVLPLLLVTLSTWLQWKWEDCLNLFHVDGKLNQSESQQAFFILITVCAQLQSMELLTIVSHPCSGNSSNMEMCQFLFTLFTKFTLIYSCYKLTEIGIQMHKHLCHVSVLDHGWSW